MLLLITVVVVFLLLFAFTAIVNEEYAVAFVLGVFMVLFITFGQIIDDGSKEIECQALGYDDNQFNSCIKSQGYIKGTDIELTCEMPLELGKTAKEWCR